MVVITIVRWGCKPTNITFGGPTLYFYGDMMVVSPSTLRYGIPLSFIIGS